MAWQKLSHFDRTRTRVEGTAQGYAGHQNFNHAGIVHMKGRIYDPTLGRFLQPDPIVEDDLNPQTWNRYTYVRNNPMTFTDPTGMASQCGERCQVRTARQRAADAVIATVMAHGSVFNGRALSDVTPAGAAVSSTTPMCSIGDATTDGAQMSAVGPKIRGRSFQRQVAEAIAVPPVYASAYSIGNVPRVAVALSLYFGAEAAGRGDGLGVGLAMMGGAFARSGGALDDVAENVDDVLRAAQAAEAKAAMSTASQGTHALRAEQQVAGDAAKLTPYGGTGGGHHVPAKSAFVGEPSYDLKTALAISNAELARLGVSHSTITGAQMTGYRAFARTGNQLTWADVAAVERRALEAGGMSQDMANTTVASAIESLQRSGVVGPTRVPWGK